MSAQGLKRLQQMAFLFAMETGLCFYGYSGNRSLAVVSPFQLLELLNPPVETKGGRYADTSSERKPWAREGQCPGWEQEVCVDATSLPRRGLMNAPSPGDATSECSGLSSDVCSTPPLPRTLLLPQRWILPRLGDWNLSPRASRLLWAGAHVFTWTGVSGLRT